MSEQLNLFGHTANVKPPQASPLFNGSVSEMLARWPNLYLGTSSWTFRGWQGLVYDGDYDQQRLVKEGLGAYSRVGLFRTVSLDSTYYRPLEEEGFQKLGRQVPDHFRFVVKTPRDLIRPAPQGFDLARLSEEFLTPCARGLGAKLGVVLLQFPPGSVAEGGPCFLEHLGKLFRGLPRGLVYSLEIRDEELLGPALRQALDATPVSLCASIHSALPRPEEQLLKVPPTPRIPLVFRWNLRPSLDYKDAKNRFHPFSELALEDQGRRTGLVRLVRRALDAGRVVYMTANNKAEGCAPLTLLKFLEELSS